MASLLGQPSQYRLAVEYHNQLGWDNFLEGRSSALWVELRARNTHDRRLERNADYWAHGLMRRLLEMVHQQWLYRNAMVHMSLQDGLPRDKHEQILTCIKDCLGIDPGDLLEEDRVLPQVDFKRLATSFAAEKLKWIAGMDSAMGAVEHIAGGCCHALHMRYCRGSQPRMRLEYEAVQVNQEGSLR